MFEQLDSIEWNELETNVGSASHVPDALKGLLSENEEEVEKAYWKIDNHVVLQGDLSESALYIPKFLEEALYITKYKRIVLELLFQIGSGISLNKHLEEECYIKVTDALLRAKDSTCIANTKWVSSIEEDLNTLRQLHIERT